MLVYWFPFVLSLLMTLYTNKEFNLIEKKRISLQLTFFWKFLFIFLVLIIGLRYEVGGDWSTYNSQINNIKNINLIEGLIKYKGQSYQFLNLLGKKWGHIYLVNSICAFIFTIGLLSYCKTQPRPWLAVLVAIPYLVTVVAMGYTRQSVAIGFVMLALAAISNGRVYRYIFWILIGATFHKTVIIVLPLVIFFSKKQIIIRFFVAFIISLIFYLIFFDHLMGNFVKNYLQNQQESVGATIRILMNVLPSLIFLIYIRHFNLSLEHKNFLIWFTITGLFLSGLILFLESTTAIDRMALYWLPLQIFIWSRVPDALSNSVGSKFIWIILISFYHGLILITWLLFASHAYMWLPYNFYPFVSQI